MKKVTVLSAIILATIITGCASTSAIDVLQSQVTEISTDVAKVSADITSANTLTAEASVKSTNAKAASLKAGELSKIAAGKLDRLFNLIVRK